MMQPCAEDHVQFAIARVLDELDLVWWHTANECLGRIGRETLDEAKRRACFLVGQGVKAGVLDFTIMSRAPAAPHWRSINLEGKKVGGRLSKDQERFIDRLRREDCYADWFQGTHDGLDRLRALGWDVDTALARLEARGEVLHPDGRLGPRRGR